MGAVKESGRTAWLVGYVAAALALTAVMAGAERGVAPRTGLVRALYAAEGFTGEPLAQTTTTDISLAFLDPARDRQLPGSVRWQGVWFFPRQETVDVVVSGDVPVDVRVAGGLVVSHRPGAETPTTRQTLTLGAGPHGIAIEIMRLSDTPSFRVEWAPTGGMPQALSPARLFSQRVGSREYWIATGLEWLRRLVIAVWLTLLLGGVLALAVWGARGTVRGARTLGRWWRALPPLSALAAHVVRTLDRHWRESRLARYVDALSTTWGRHRLTLDRASAIFALTAFAIAQPLFAVLAESPEFFVARNTPLDRVVAVAVIIGVLLPLAIVAVERIIRTVSKPAATVVHCAVLAVLTAAAVVPPLERGGLNGPGLGVATAAIALAIALGYWRVASVRFFLTILAPAAFVAPGIFLLDRGIRDALVPSAVSLATNAPEHTPPIVFIVFDEFPLNSLLDAERQIDATRYPNFAALAREAYWFRNASTVSGNTVWAVPAIVSGQYPTARYAVPTLRYYPNNLFTLLGSRYEMFVFGRFLQLCPESMCRYDLEATGDSVTALLDDLSVVWLHIVLPEPLRAGLPPIIGDWQGFARARQWRTSGDQLVRNERGTEFGRFLSTIDGKPAKLHFLHMLIPHMPFQYVPSGRRYLGQDYQSRGEKGRPLFERASPEYADALHQRHLLQVGFVDTLIGRLIARLRAVGAYDSALVIITADHGASYREGGSRRSPRGQSVADIMLVPLIVKVPGQDAGSVVDRNVETVDILPTIASVLSVGLPLPLPGHSLLKPGATERQSKTLVRRSMANVSVDTVKEWTQQAEASLQRKLQRFGSGATSLYSTPLTRDLPGRPATQFAKRTGGGIRVALENPERLVAVDIAGETLPLSVRGRIEGPASAPLTLAIVMNDMIAATTASYQEAGTHVLRTLVPEEYLRAGANEVEVFVVEEEQGRTVLRPTR